VKENTDYCMQTVSLISAHLEPAARFHTTYSSSKTFSNGIRRTATSGFNA
jgi:hypothetical protein